MTNHVDITVDKFVLIFICISFLYIISMRNKWMRLRR